MLLMMFLGGTTLFSSFMLMHLNLSFITSVELMLYTLTVLGISYFSSTINPMGFNFYSMEDNLLKMVVLLFLSSMLVLELLIFWGGVVN